MKAIIVEDEPLARAGLTAYILEVGFIELLDVCDNAIEANQSLVQNSPDLMFLDIQMPKITGIDFLKALAKPPLVILTTAYPNYAIQGFELNVVDYLVKPYSFERFFKAVNKAQELHRYQQTPLLQGQKDHFFAKTDNRMERINFNEILYVEAMENYVGIITGNGRTITLMTMKAMENLLPPQQFIRVHKTYIVSIDKVKSIEGNEIIINGKYIPISRQRRKETLMRIFEK